MDGWPTPAWVKTGVELIAQGRLQSRASRGTRYWSQDTAQGYCSREKHKAGTTSEAIVVLKNRLQQGITTDPNTYVRVLQMCLKEKDLLAAKQVHDSIIESGIIKNPFVAVTLLNVYIKCGRLLDARRVFYELEKKSVITWTNMIGGYVQNDHPESALELFNQMRQEGVEPNEITYLSILKACGSPSALKWGREIRECIRHAGFKSIVRVGTALVKMYAKCGCMMEASQVFEKLTNRDVVTWTDDAQQLLDRMEKRNIVTWNLLIGGHAQHGCGHEAYRLFCQMIREGFEPDAITYINILNAFASAGPLEWLKEVHDRASKAGVVLDLRVSNALVHMYAKSGSIDDARQVFDRIGKRDMVTWNVMIGGLVQHGCGHEAYRLFRQMRREGFEPNAFTYTSIQNAFASAGALEMVKEVNAHACQVGLDSDLSVANALVYMYAESGSIKDSRRVFDKMKKRDTVTWNVMISGLAQHGSGNEAYRMFAE